MRLRYYRWALLTLVALPLNARGDDEGGGEVKPEDMQTKVQVAPAKSGEIQVVLHAIGVVVPRPGTLELAATKVAGLVTKVAVREGDAVVEGATLAEIDDRPFKEALAKATAAKHAAELDIAADEETAVATQQDLDLGTEQAALEAKQASKDAERIEALVAEHLASEKAATEARQAATSKTRIAEASAAKAKRFRENGRPAAKARLQAAVEAADLDIKVAERDLEGLVIKAPAAGHVTALLVTPGARLESGATVARISPEAGLSVRAGISCADVDRIEKDAGADAKAAGERGAEGKVVSIGAVCDPDTGLVPVVIDLEKSEHAPRLGESVFLEIETGEASKGLLVPVSALLVDGDEAHVMVVGADNIAHKLEVKVLARNSEQASIEGEGLKEGASIIVEGNDNLPDGAHVVPEKAK